MKSILSLALIFFITLATSDTKVANVDLEKLAEKYSAEYIKSSSIAFSKGESTLVCISDKEGKFVKKSILLQSRAKDVFNKKGEFEFLVFDDILVVKDKYTVTAYKLSDRELPANLAEDLKNSNVVNLYGIGAKNTYGIDIPFSLNDISQSVLATTLAIDRHSKDIDAFACGCNTGTTSCSCAQGTQSCSVSCASGYYACCKKIMFGGVSCNCEEQPSGGGNKQ